MVIFGIFAYPLGSFLDWLLGKHGAKRFPKRDLKALIELHKVTKKVHMKKNETDVPDSHMPKKSHHDAHSHNLVIDFILIYKKTSIILKSLKIQVFQKKRLK